MLKYIADVIVNGPDPSLGAVGGEPAILDPTVPSLDPAVDMPEKTEPSLRDIYVEVRGCIFVEAGGWVFIGHVFFFVLFFPGRMFCLRGIYVEVRG